MIMRYDLYKDSGVEWIGEIPGHWDIKKNKYFTQSQKNKSEKGDEELLSVSEKFGVITRKSIREDHENLTRSESLIGYLKVKKGELVSNIMLMWKRGLGVSEHNGIVSPSYSVFSFLNSEPKYFHYLFRTDQYVSEFRRNSTGVIDSRLRLYDDSFGSLKSHFPPLNEQKKIVDFLDKKTTQIDELVKKTEQKIELLKEQRISLISKVVTKGLNPDMEMKESGVEWIGEIPSNWEIKKLKYLVKHIKEKNTPGEEDIKISPEYVESDTGICFNQYSEHSGDGYKFIYGDILLNKLRIYLKKTLLVDFEGYSIGEMIVLRTEKKDHSEFIFNCLFSDDLIGYLNSLSTGVKVPRVSPDEILSTKFPLPPTEEISKINEFIKYNNVKIYNQISIEEKRIKLLKEYKQSLISEVVLGKKRVV